MRVKYLDGMVPVGVDCHVAVDAIEALGPYTGPVPVGGNVLNATGGKPARSRLRLRSGLDVFSPFTAETVVKRIRMASK
jgi:hypothetical protein